MKQILVVIGGSRAYGMETQSSDVDLKGVHICNVLSYMGLENKIEALDAKGVGWFDDVPWNDHEHLAKIPREGVTYEIIKFFRLAMKCNPNILDTIFVHPSDIIFANESGRKILENRELFLSLNCIDSFKNYANSNIHEVEKSLSEAGEPWAGDPRLLASFAPQMQGRYLRGFKHAAHSVRILQSLLQLLKSGIYSTKQRNRDELQRFRNGNFSLSDFIEKTNEIKNEVSNSIHSSPLKDVPDLRAINELCFNILNNELLKG